MQRVGKTMETTLTGVRVLDLSMLPPGAFCCMILGDLGAEIVKVESHLLGDLTRQAPPHVGQESCYFMSVNRNKKSIALNLKRKEGREIALKLARTADVIIEGFRPGRVKRLGIAYGDIQPLNPDIVYCSLSGYGQEGPFRDRAGHDINYAALAGMLDVLTQPGEAVFVPGVQLADLAGALFAAIGILSALVARSLRGTGMYIDVSLFDSVLSLMTGSAATCMSADTPVERGQRYVLGTYPCYRVYETKDGRYMALGAAEAVFWADFCEAIGRKDLVPKRIPEGTERESVLSEIQRIFAGRTREEWMRFFADKNVCCEPVNTLEEALSAPQVTGRDMLWEIDHPTAGRLQQIGLPLRSGLSTSEGLRRTASPPPLLGQHTVEILQSLGYDDDAIQQLRAKRVVTTSEDVAARRKKP